MPRGMGASKGPQSPLGASARYSAPPCLPAHTARVSLNGVLPICGVQSFPCIKIPSDKSIYPEGIFHTFFLSTKCSFARKKTKTPGVATPPGAPTDAFGTGNEGAGACSWNDCKRTGGLPRGMGASKGPQSPLGASRTRKRASPPRLRRGHRQN